MKPIQICNQLGAERIGEYYDELSGREIRSIFKAAGVRTSVGNAAYSRAGRLKVWRRRFDSEVGKGNEKLALAFLLEWLMGHHRVMLEDFLDHLEVSHTGGQTDEDFCETRTPEQLRDGAKMLLGKYTPHHVATYLLLVGHLQETPVFDTTPEVLAALGMSEADARAHAAEQEARAAKAAS